MVFLNNNKEFIPSFTKKYLDKCHPYSNEKKIAIIGAGIAGLTLVNLLKKNSDYEFKKEKQESLSLMKDMVFNFRPIAKILNLIGFNKIDNEKTFNPKGVDFYNIQNKKICDLDLTQFNTDQNKYTTLQRSLN